MEKIILECVHKLDPVYLPVLLAMGGLLYVIRWLIKSNNEYQSQAEVQVAAIAKLTTLMEILIHGQGGKTGPE